MPTSPLKSSRAHRPPPLPLPSPPPPPAPPPPPPPPASLCKASESAVFPGLESHQLDGKFDFNGFQPIRGSVLLPNFRSANEFSRVFWRNMFTRGNKNSPNLFNSTLSLMRLLQHRAVFSVFFCFFTGI